MLEKLFFKSRSLYNNYLLKTDEIVVIEAKEIIEEREEVTAELLEKVHNVEFVVVKCISYEPDVKHYIPLLKNEKDFINKAIESIKEKNKTSKFIFLVNKNVETMVKKLQGVDIVKGYNEKKLKDEDNLINEVVGKGKKSIVLDLVQLYYLGSELSGQDNIIFNLWGDFDGSNSVVKAQNNITIKEIINNFNIDESSITKIVGGGVLRGNGIYDLNNKITRDTVSLTISKTKETLTIKNCIRCGQCINSCHKRLNPTLLVAKSEKNNVDEFITYGGQLCDYCGLCTFNCPSNIQLSHKIKTTNHHIKKQHEVRSGKNG